MPQSELHTLEIIRANALAVVKSCDNRIALLNKPARKVNKRIEMGAALAKQRNEQRYK